VDARPEAVDARALAALQLEQLQHAHVVVRRRHHLQAAVPTGQHDPARGAADGHQRPLQQQLQVL